MLTLYERQNRQIVLQVFANAQARLVSLSKDWRAIFSFFASEDE
jgi:hypothetical protein